MGEVGKKKWALTRSNLIQLALVLLLCLLFRMLLILRIEGVAPYARVFIQAVSKRSLPYLSPSFLRLAQALYPCSGTLPDSRK